jgi:D-beta-D-heptose 7-phosphate kinase / D-beta-D-heptose 1-phosphate adenosyltransferase
MTSRPPDGHGPRRAARPLRAAGERVRACVIGDALLDIDWDGAVDRVCRDAPALVLETPVERARPGGAALTATLAAASGARATLVTALSDDADGRRLAELVAASGVDVVNLGLDGPTPVKLRLRAGGQSLARVDRACSPVACPGVWTDAATAALAAADAVIVSDYGRGLAALTAVTAALGKVAAPVVWDPHPAGARPPSSAALVTPSQVEAHGLMGRHDSPPEHLSDLVALASDVTRALGCPTALTLGARGALVTDGRSHPILVPTSPVPGDPCGAGDRFAASAALALARGEPLADAVAAAVADARDFVAGDRDAPPTAADAPPRAGPDADAPVIRLHGTARGRGATSDVASAAAVAEAVRRQRGVVVAAGGCFDVLHAGHVWLLEEARRLGDHLVVCLNGDDSVRRLKGPGRPINGADDRAAVLRSLACVDDVVVFDEDTPSRALAALRPHLFAKGADYQGADIEEQAVIERWGGHVVLLPLVPGRSTTRIITDAASAAG